ncbi:MAG: sulfite exporter TauE/SafE family protein [Bacteroidota bacterium]
MELEFYHYLIAVVGSTFAGFINTLAGNGSAITLTILTEILQLPGNMANGTNRVGVIAQASASTFAFYKNDKLDLTKESRPIIFITLGAIFGILVAIYVSNEQFKQVFRFMMVVMLFAILIKPKRWLQKSDSHKNLSPWVSIPLFLALGFYGGFIQMGMGVMFLIVAVLIAGYNIISANILKAFVVALYTVVAIAVFHWQGFIDWKIGMVMAVGQTAGGWWTANFASNYPQADIWAYRVLVVVVIGALLNMFGIFQKVAELF